MTERPAPNAPKDAGSPAAGLEEEGWTLDKVAKLGLAGVLSIAVAESVFWVRNPDANPDPSSRHNLVPAPHLASTLSFPDCT